MDTTARMRTAGRAYQKLRLGDPIRTQDLNIAIEVFEEQLVLLDEMGPSFQLMRTEVLRSLIQLRGFQEARLKRA